MNMFITLILVGISWIFSYSKFVRLYTIDIYNFFYKVLKRKTNWDKKTSERSYKKTRIISISNRDEGGAEFKCERQISLLFPACHMRKGQFYSKGQIINMPELR
jgi:hypothetical protein